MQISTFRIGVPNKDLVLTLELNDTDMFMPSNEIDQSDLKLSLQPEEYDAEDSKKQNWLYRYDCIVSEALPAIALQSSAFEIGMATFNGSEKQIITACQILRYNDSPFYQLEIGDHFIVVSYSKTEGAKLKLRHKKLEFSQKEKEASYWRVEFQESTERKSFVSGASEDNNPFGSFVSREGSQTLGTMVEHNHDYGDEDEEEMLEDAQPAFLSCLTLRDPQKLKKVEEETCSIESEDLEEEEEEEEKQDKIDNPEAKKAVPSGMSKQQSENVKLSQDNKLIMLIRKSIDKLEKQISAERLSEYETAQQINKKISELDQLPSQSQSEDFEFEPNESNTEDVLKAQRRFSQQLDFNFFQNIKKSGSQKVKKLVEYGQTKVKEGVEALKSKNEENDGQPRNSEELSVNFTSQTSEIFKLKPEIKRHQRIQSNITSANSVLSEEEWDNIIQGYMNIKEVSRQRLFNSLFSQQGIGDLRRGAIWCKLINIEEIKSGYVDNIYQKLSTLDNVEIKKCIEDDEIAFRSGLKQHYGDEEFVHMDSKSIENVLLAYSNLDIEFGYTQGYNFIVALLLVFIKDEEDVFWCLCKIMIDMKWRELFLNKENQGELIQENLSYILKENVPRLHAQLDEDDNLDVVCKNLFQQYTLSLFTNLVPVNISKRTFELFIFEQKGIETVIRLLLKMISYQEDKILQMQEKQRFDYLRNGGFIFDSFQENLIENLFK